MRDILGIDQTCTTALRPQFDGMESHPQDHLLSPIPDVCLPANLLFSRPSDAPLESEEHTEKLLARMEEMHHLARDRIGMASEEMKTQYMTQKRRNTIFTKMTKCSCGI
ncbi:hypothetical protein TNCV_1255531 [Trichonephila clavipes]|nr:hypothetical protein TNCV_1255531 [Trichonephila clavipes]